jgi:hypothetical protein
MPDRIAALLRQPTARLGRLLRRHRRPVAAALAGIAVLLALTTLRAAPEAGAVSEPGSTPTTAPLPSGDVLVPLPLRLPAVAAALHVGDLVDVVALPGEDAGAARVVAPRARIVELPSGGSALTGSSASVLLVSVREDDALEASAAAAGSGVTVLIRER